MLFFNNSIQKLFHKKLVYNQHGLELAYEDLTTIYDFWSFLENNIIGEIEKIESEKMVTNKSTSGLILYGPLKMRQIRVEHEHYRINGLSQQKLTREKHQAYISDRLLSKENDQDKFNEIFYFKEEENHMNIVELEKIFWINSGSRVVLIEFVLYNTNVNMFCNAKFIAEILPTGGVMTSTQIQVLKYYPLFSGGEYFVLCLSVAFLGLVLYFSTITAKAVLCNMTKKKLTLAVSNVDIIFNLVISYSVIIYVIWHTFYLRSIIESHEKDTNQHLTLDKLCYWNGLFIDILGVCVFIAWIESFRYMKFNNTMRHFFETLLMCLKDLVGFGIIFVIVFVAFALMAVMLIGPVNSDFCDFSTAITTFMKTVLGDFDLGALEADSRVVGQIFCASFIILVFFILTNMFLAIISERYSMVKSNMNEIGTKKLEEIYNTFIEGSNSTQSARTFNNPEKTQQTKNIDKIIKRYFEIISIKNEDVKINKYNSLKQSGRSIPQVIELEKKLIEIETSLNKINDAEL